LKKINFNKFLFNKKSSDNKYLLLDDAFSNEDIISGIKVLLSKQITMSKITLNFEKLFSKFIKSKYSIMVNSGSSANLLAVFAALNPLRKHRFYPGDEVILPAICWSTSLWPLVQAGLKPVFVDVDPLTLNMDCNEVLKKINKKTKVIMAVHVLGNSTNMNLLTEVSKKKKIILIEDTCESLGSKYNGKYLGTFGDFGTFSFYYSHQITTGEGGMVTCNSYNDYKLLYSLRSHGWARGPAEIKNKKIFNKLNKKFVFINSGFNLRPTDVASSIGISQLKRLKTFMKIRSDNREKIINIIKKSKKWKNQFEFIESAPNIKPSWFGLPILVSKKYVGIKNIFLDYLNKNNIETRPIISGNFLNQPSIKLYNLNPKNVKFPNSQEIEDRGFFIGIHTKNINPKQLNYLEKHMLKIDQFI
jgi:CDP-6-deoxy-D-xylo-4-hexulose-3-dehydrase